MANFTLKYDRVVLGGATTQMNVSSTSLNQYAGDTVIVSRDTFVAAPLVAATSRIQLQAHWLGTNSLSVNPGLVVSSIQAGSGFFITTVQSVGFSAAGGASYAAWWEIRNP